MRFLFFFLVSFLLQTAVLAQHRDIKVVIPFSAGGPADQIWKPIEAELNARLDKNKIRLVREYAPGAGGVIAVNRIINSNNQPVLGFFSTAIVIAPVINSAATYNSSSFRLIGYMGSTDMVVVSALSIDDFNTKCKNGTITYGSAGIGSNSHLLGSTIVNNLQCKDPIHVPYKGIIDVYPDVIGKRVDFVVDLLNNATNYTVNNQLTILFNTNTYVQNELIFWYVLVSNKIQSNELAIIEQEIKNIKSDVNFIKELEKNLKINNLNQTKNQSWFDNEFLVYRTYIEQLK
jgi:tripartite-type tricarboxylate transporter receptor subunit TctC